MPNLKFDRRTLLTLPLTLVACGGEDGDEDMADWRDPRRTTGASKGLPGYPSTFKNAAVPGSSAFNVNPNPIQANQPHQGPWAASRYSQQGVMVHYNAANTKTSGTSRAYVFSPSARLRVSVVVVPESGTFAPNVLEGAFNGAGNLGIGGVIYSGIVNPDTGLTSFIAQVLPSGTNPVLQPIPFGFEADSAVSVLRVSTIVSNLDWSVPGGLGGGDINLKLIATWEPNCEIQKTELEQLFRQCKITTSILEMGLT